MGAVKIVSTMTGNVFYILGVSDDVEGVRLCEAFADAVEDGKTDMFYEAVEKFYEIVDEEDMIFEPVIYAQTKFRF